MPDARKHLLTGGHSRPALAGVALGCFVLHSGYYVWSGSSSEVLWACNVASLWIGLGAVLGAGGWVAVGLSWLVLGTPLWLGYLAAGGELCVTSLGIHLVAPLVALRLLTKLGWPSGSWLFASLLLLGLLVLSRALGEPSTNVNLAFRVWQGWESWFSVHWHYLLVVGLAHVAAFYGIERWVQWRRWFAPAER